MWHTSSELEVWEELVWAVVALPVSHVDGWNCTRVGVGDGGSAEAGAARDWTGSSLSLSVLMCNHRASPCGLSVWENLTFLTLH